MKTDKTDKIPLEYYKFAWYCSTIRTEFRKCHIVEFLYETLLFLINEENLERYKEGERYFAREELRFSSFVTSIDRLLIKKWNIHIVLKKTL